MRGFDLEDLAEVAEECRYPQVQVEVDEDGIGGLFDRISARLLGEVSARAREDFQREVFGPWRERVNQGDAEQGEAKVALARRWVTVTVI